MKKYWPYVIAGIAVALIAGSISLYLVFGRETGKTNQNSYSKATSLSLTESLCDQISSSVIEEALGKTIIKTEPKTSATTNVCQYYVDTNHFISLRLNQLSYENQKVGQTNLDRQITTNSDIKAEHFMAVQENGLINGIYLKINENLFLAVDRSSTSSADEAEIVQLAIAIADFLGSGGIATDQVKTKNIDEVSLLGDEEFITNFFKLIEDGKANEAVLLMSSQNTSDDSIKQAWGVQFNYMSSVKVISVNPQNQSDWTDDWRQYKVLLDVVMNPNSANAPIPYYGYENGQNIRYLALVKEDGAWRVDTIATGP